jgi:hypothetical protein
MIDIGVRKGVRKVFLEVSIFFRTLDRTLSGHLAFLSPVNNALQVSGSPSGLTVYPSKSVCPSGGESLRLPPYGHFGKSSNNWRVKWRTIR